MGKVYDFAKGKYHPATHGGNEEKAYKMFHKDFAKEVKGAEEKLEKLKDNHTLALINAKKAVGYDFEKDSSQLKEYANQTVEHFEKVVRDNYGIADGKAVDEIIFRNRFGMTQKELYKLIHREGSNSAKEIEEKLAIVLREESNKLYGSIANEYIVDKHTADHAAKFVGLNGLDEFDKTGLTHDAMRSVFLNYMLNNKVLTPRLLPEGMKKKTLEELVKRDKAA